ncbi:hypothetical protein [Aliiruegeria lutimaris]|uniref:Uncharacterized protein n=1 Tax=Aliiruegeria lutimaris TaxID=571298 RepID=A0A1G9LEM1_9RHOB|nr:hypothetical protein [Aliiruegeria lutimaris]SDL60324.1 hypothetical protein SAMN04488026_10975 [Aliiruegeria lutimaris]
MNEPVRISETGHVTVYVERDDKDLPVFTLEARALTPLRHKFAGALAACSALGGIGVSLAAAGAAGESAAALAIGGCLGSLITAPIQRWGWARLIRKRHLIVISAESFGFRSRRGWREIPRNEMGSFSMPQHSKAKKEARQIEHRLREASKKGESYEPGFVYADSHHLMFDHIKTQVSFMDVYGTEAAVEIFGEIESHIAIIEGERGYGRGTALSPEQDHAQRSGKLPQRDARETPLGLPGPGVLPVRLEDNRTAILNETGEWGFIEAKGEDDE